jgi:hypothetical protein
MMDSPDIAISVPSNAPKGKSAKDGGPDDNAFSVSLEVARKEAKGEPSVIAQSGTANRSHSQSGSSDEDDATVSISVTVTEDETTGETEATSITIDGLTTGDVSGDNVEEETLSISVTVSDDETTGETETTTSITIEGLGTDGEGSSESDLTIEIETVSFAGDELASALSASTVLGGGTVAETADGSFGVDGSVSGSADIRLEIGETLTFSLPAIEDGEVVGGQVTITNLFSNGETREGALVFAYDADDQQLACYCALGNETGVVTIDIDVSFARLDFKALDNDSWFLQENSNFAVGDVDVNVATFVGNAGLEEGDVMSDLLAYGNKIHNADLLDIGHFGTVNFEIGRISVNKQVAINSLRTVDADQERDPERLHKLGDTSGLADLRDPETNLPLWIERSRAAG